MKKEIRYCPVCKKETIHVKYNNLSAGEKVFFSVATIGILPLMDKLVGGGQTLFRYQLVCDVCDNVKESNP